MIWTERLAQAPHEGDAEDAWLYVRVFNHGANAKSTHILIPRGVWYSGGAPRNHEHTRPSSYLVNANEKRFRAGCSCDGWGDSWGCKVH